MFRLHNKMPQPGRCVMINAKIDDGVYMAVPLLHSQFSAVVSTMLSNTKVIDFSDRKNFSSKKIAEATAEIMEEITGWAPIFQALPHVLLDYQPSMTEEFPSLLSDLQQSIQLKMVRKVVPANRSFIVQTTVTEDIVIVEPSDLIDIADSEDYAKHDVLEVPFEELGFKEGGSQPKAVSISIKVDNKQTTLPVEGGAAAAALRQITDLQIPAGADEGNPNATIETDDVGDFEQLLAALRAANPDMSEADLKKLAKKQANKGIVGDPSDSDEK